MSSTKNIQKKIPSKPVPNPKSKITKQKKSLSQNKKKNKNESPKKILSKKQRRISESNSSDDSSDEEVLVRTGDVPENWYDGMKNVGYDINSQKVMKNKEEDEIEKFIKKANDKNWWREIYDSKNNASVYLSDKDLEIINRIRQGKMANKSV